MLLQPTIATAQSRPSTVQEDFITANYRIQIINNCGEGVVVCKDMTYIGTHRRTGRSISLKGQTVHTICNDGITPCRFDGYRFKNGEYTYVVTISNSLMVLRNDREILYEAQLNP